LILIKTGRYVDVVAAGIVELAGRHYRSLLESDAVDGVPFGCHFGHIGRSTFPRQGFPPITRTSISSYTGFNGN
jgi:hypothetical protein